MRFELNRRHIVAGGLAAGLTPFLSGPASAALELACDPRPRPATAKPERAVSLRRLSEAMKAGKPARLEGLTRLDGFILDKENQDVILWGLSERNQPELHLPDLVVALRAAHGRYYEKRDGVTYIVNPLISIDPDLNVYRELDKIAVRDPARKAKHAAICARPQTVRVEGMPHNSRVAKVLVEADYRMKMVSQGDVILPIASPFPGTYTVRLREWRNRIDRGADLGPGHKTRYWFEPGRFSYQYSEEADTVFLDTAQVVLRDEDQRSNTNIASGKVDPISREFACAWTARMEDTYRAEPIWRDMHNIFRLFAVSRIIADRKAFREVAFAQDMLLDRYELPVVPVPKIFAGPRPLGRIQQARAQELHPLYQLGLRRRDGGLYEADRHDRSRDRDLLVRSHRDRGQAARDGSGQLAGIAGGAEGDFRPFAAEIAGHCPGGAEHPRCWQAQAARLAERPVQNLKRPLKRSPRQPLQSTPEFAAGDRIPSRIR